MVHPPGARPESAADDLATLVRRAAQTWPDRVAITFPDRGRSATFAEIDRRTDRMASGLAGIGVSRGDPVAVMLPNRLEFPLVWLALAKLGAVMVPLNTHYRTADGSYVLNHAGSRMLITDAAHLERALSLRPECPKLMRLLSVDGAEAPDVLGLADLEAVAATAEPPRPTGEQLVNIQYTSGTTGHPKGCMLSHFYWCRLARVVESGPPALACDDVLLTAQPFYYMDLQWNVATALLTGARLVVLPRFHPSSFWRDVREHGVTFFYCIGMMPRALYNMPPSAQDREHRVRGIVCSGIPRELHREFEQRWGAPWYEAFGMTETGGDLRVSDADRDAAVGSGCIGRPYSDREARVVDDRGDPVPRGTTGELVLRGPGMMDGYLHDDEATARVFRRGWLHTGDLVKQDEAGRFYYLGRTKDMIRRSGENISAAEVEAVLCSHPRLREAACVAVPDQLRGEEVHAYLVAQEPTDGPPLEAIHSWAGERLAYFKVPRYWTFLDAMPKTPSERVAKTELTRTATHIRATTWDAKDNVYRGEQGRDGR